MYATATILLEERPNVLSLPAAAVVRDAEGACCYVIRDGKALRTPIETGLRAGDDVEVLSGVAGDSTVILVGAANLSDGKSVEVIEAEKKP
jgi:membrane fusion protein (multidrug efflux system)